MSKHDRPGYRHPPESTEPRPAPTPANPPVRHEDAEQMAATLDYGKKTGLIPSGSTGRESVKDLWPQLRYETAVFSGGQPDKLQVFLNERADRGLRCISVVQRAGNEMLLVFESI